MTPSSSTTCEALHRLARLGRSHAFPFAPASLPRNGIYVLFEEGENGHGGRRIVRIGTHTGDGQLASRLREHFLVENKDRSIFRKNIGRALLRQASDPYLAEWEIDRTTRAARERLGLERQPEKRRAVEAAATARLQQHFSFVLFDVDDKAERLRLESRMISTVSTCQACRPSPAWLGLHSPKNGIRESGLWLVNELYKVCMTDDDLAQLDKALVRPNP